MSSRSQPLLAARESAQPSQPYETDSPVPPEPKEGSWKAFFAEHLESRDTHRFVLTLIALDATFVLTDLSYTFLAPQHCSPTAEEERSPEWLEVFSYLSLAITCLFLVEIPLDFWAFGPRYFGISPRYRAIPHAFLHAFDALVIIGTAVFEIVLRGRERELAGLLVLLRLWRLIKLVGGVAVGVGSWDEEAVRLMAAKDERIKELEGELAALHSPASQ